MAPEIENVLESLRRDGYRPSLLEAEYDPETWVIVFSPRKTKPGITGYYFAKGVAEAVALEGSPSVFRTLDSNS